MCKEERLLCGRANHRDRPPLGTCQTLRYRRISPSDWQLRADARPLDSADIVFCCFSFPEYCQEVDHVLGLPRWQRARLWVAQKQCCEPVPAPQGTCY